jgi:uncharacterized SAM-binding protein YcdF (DUF218 family)
MSNKKGVGSDSGALFVDQPMRDYVIVFGAAVRANGKPSLALRRRIDRAAGLAAEHPDAMIMPTGGTGEHGAAEAKVIKQTLVDAGIAARRIVVEPCGRDTLESIRLCDRLLRKRGDCGRVIVCTSRYHQPRCALLFRLLGWNVLSPKMTAGIGRLRRRTYARMIAREMLALPYDAMLLLTGWRAFSLRD